MHFKQCLGTCFLVTVGMCWKRIGNFPRMGELTGNALKTLWGMSWELIRNRWDAFECFLHFIHYRILLIYYIIYCTNTTYYTSYKYSILYTAHTCSVQ
jgi:hypothetical protein